MKNLYDENYYERGIETGVSCYSNYRWIPELTIPMAARLIEYLGIAEHQKILDFGCAKGYLVKAFRLLHREAYGYDKSEYAINCVPEEIKDYIRNQVDGGYDWIISKDVFEHIPYQELPEILTHLRKSTKHLFAIVPLAEKGKYVVPAYELDTTHIVRENLDWWKSTFERAGFTVRDASYSVKYIKENWAAWEHGNGFFILESE